MDTSSEIPSNPPTPETHAERVRTVSDLIQGQGDEVQPGQGQGDEDRADLPGDDGQGGQSEPAALDHQESDETPGVQDDPEAGEAPTDESEAPGAGDPDIVTLAQLAEHLGGESADLYELEIPLGDGQEPVTLGQLKDEFKEYGPAKAFQEQLTTERQAFERAQLQTRSELNAIINMIPEAMREQVIQAGRERSAAYIQDQEQAVLEAIPEWANADQRATDRAQLVEDGAEYGFSEQEITYTHDARTLRMLRDFAKMKRELQAMKAAGKAQPGQATPPGKPVRNTQSKRKLAQLLQRGKSDPSIQGKAAVVSQLIRNQ